MKKILSQIVKFWGVGAWDALVDLGVLNLEMLIFGIGGWFGYGVMKAVSSLVSMTNGYFLHKRVTFGSRKPATRSEAVKFYITAIAAFVMNVSFAAFIYGHLSRFKPAGWSASEWATFAAGACLVGPIPFWDFLTYKYWVFPERRKASAARASFPASFPEREVVIVRKPVVGFSSSGSPTSSAPAAPATAATTAAATASTKAAVAQSGGYNEQFAAKDVPSAISASAQAKTP